MTLSYSFVAWFQTFGRRDRPNAAPKASYDCVTRSSSQCLRQRIDHESTSGEVGYKQRPQIFGFVFAARLSRTRLWIRTEGCDKDAMHASIDSSGAFWATGWLRIDVIVWPPLPRHSTRRFKRRHSGSDFAYQCARTPPTMLETSIKVLSTSRHQLPPSPLPKHQSDDSVS